MDYQTILDGMKRFGSTERDICVHGIGVAPEQVREHVILAPWWEPSAMPALGKAEYLSASDFSAVKVWNITTGKMELTYIKTGIGAPVLMDVVLSLGVTPCRKILFIGSVGALDPAMGIGDLVIPEYSVCGDGASRYLAGDDLEKRDCWGEKVFPDPALWKQVEAVTDDICRKGQVKWHRGKNFSIDTITAQYAHIDTILDLGCNVIEMETAAAFRAAKLAGLSLAALFSVSDNTLVNKSLVSGRTEEEMDYRRFVRRTVFPQVLLKTFEQELI